MLRMQEESLQEPSFSRSVTDRHQKAYPDPIWASIWDPFGQPKSIPDRSGDRPDGHWILDIEFKGWCPSERRLGCTPDPGPWYPVIYILESSARFARAQFSLNHQSTAWSLNVRRNCENRTGNDVEWRGHAFSWGQRLGENVECRGPVSLCGAQRPFGFGLGRGTRTPVIYIYIYIYIYI